MSLLVRALAGLEKGWELLSLIDADLPLITNLLEQFGDRFLRLRLLVRATRNGHVVIVIAEDHCSSARPACGHSRQRNDNGYEQEGRYFTTQQEPGRRRRSRRRSPPPGQPRREGRPLPSVHNPRQRRAPSLRRSPPGCYGESPLRRRSTHSDPLALRRLAFAVHDAGPLRIPLAVSGRPAEPDGLALDPWRQRSPRRRPAR